MSSLLTERILTVISVLHAGERADARARFIELWTQLDAVDHFHRCVVAHYMADAQDDPRSELHWDQMALDAAKSASPDEFDDRFPAMTLVSFFPSLHLNLAASYEKVGLLEKACEHADLAHRATNALPDSPLGTMTANAIERIRLRLHSGNDRSPVREDLE